MGFKQHPDFSEHENNLQTFDRPFEHFAHNDHKGEKLDVWAHPDTRCYVGLAPPNNLENQDYLETQRAEHGYPMTRKAIDTSLRFYDPSQDIARSCPSV